MSATKDEDKNIVVLATDNSSHSRDTVTYYMKKIHKPGNKILLTHVIEMPENAVQAMQYMMSVDKIREMWKAEEENARQLEAEYVQELKKQGVNQEDITINNRGGMKPGHVICHVADEENASLIVIGSRGAGKIRRTILGSVSDYIVHHAHCPVLVCNYGKEQAYHYKEDHHSVFHGLFSHKRAREDSPSGQQLHNN